MARFAQLRRVLRAKIGLPYNNKSYMVYERNYQANPHINPRTPPECADLIPERLTMAKLTSEAREQLNTIITTDYEECHFFSASAQLLANKIKDFSERIQDQETTFEQLKDEVGQIGIFLGNAEKRLQEVEDCYTRLIDALADNMNSSKEA